MIVKDWLRKSRIVMAVFAFVVTALLLCKGDTVYAAAPIATEGYFDVEIYDHNNPNDTRTYFRVYLDVPVGSNSASSYSVSARQYLTGGANCVDVSFSSGMSKQDGWAFVNPPHPDRYFITPITVDLRKVNGNSDYFIYDRKLENTTEQNAGDENTFVFEKANNKVTIDIDTNNSGLTALAGEGGMASAHCTLKIEVAKKNWNVRVHPNGGTYNDTTDTTTRGVTYGEETWNNIGKPSRTGYTFDGWYTADGTEVYDKNGNWVKCAWWGDNGRYHVLGDIDVYAHWTAKKSTLTLDPNGGKYNNTTGTTDKEMQYDAASNRELGCPTRDNYTFEGWYTKKDGGTPAFDKNGYAIQYNRNTNYWKGGSSWSDGWMGGSYTDWSNMTWNRTSNLTVYAHWKINSYKQIVKVRYQKSDGTWGSYSDVINKNYDYGSTVSWSRNQDDTYKAASLSYTVSKAETKYVDVYRRKYHQTLKVKWQKSDGNWTDFTKKIDGDYYYGATVGAWSQKDTDEYKGTSSSSYTVNGANEKELYVYRKTYTQIVNVKYQDKDGNWGTATQKVKEDYYYGSTFSWSEDSESARYEKVSTSYTVKKANTTTLNRKRRKYTQTIYYYLDVASGKYNSPSYTAAKTAANNAKTWDIFYEATFNAKAQCAAWGNVAGYHWNRINSDSWVVKGAASTNSYYRPNKYRLNVNVNGGKGTNGSFDMEYGTSIDLGTPTRTGWKFMGWTIESNNSTNSKLSGNQFVMGYNNSYKHQNYMMEASVKIIANWQDATAPNASDTILKATNPAKTTVYASVTGNSPVAETPWVNNNVLLTFSSKDNETGLSELSIFEKITNGWKNVASKTLNGETTVQTTSYTDSAEGSKIYYGRAADNASVSYGNPKNIVTNTAELTVL